MAANPSAAHRHVWEGLYCPVDGVGSSETIRALEAEVKQLKDEKRALIEALEAIPKLDALRKSIESELLSEARGGKK